MKAPSPRRPAPASTARPAPMPRSRSRASRTDDRGRDPEPDAPSLPASLPPAPVAPTPVPPAPPVQPPPVPASSPTDILSQLHQITGPLDLETTADDSGGAYFVRMIAPTNMVRAVPVGAVCNRLCNGWRFIEDEPVIPRVHCDVANHDTCDQAATPGFFPRGRGMTEAPRTKHDALRVWISEFQADLSRYHGRRDLDANYVRRLVSQFRVAT